MYRGLDERLAARGAQLQEHRAVVHPFFRLRARRDVEAVCPRCPRPPAGERRGQELLGDFESLRDVDVDGDEPAGRLAVEQPEVPAVLKDMWDLVEPQSPLLPALHDRLFALTLVGDHAYSGEDQLRSRLVDALRVLAN